MPTDIKLYQMFGGQKVRLYNAYQYKLKKEVLLDLMYILA